MAHLYDIALLNKVKEAYGVDKNGLIHAERVAEYARSQEEWVVALCHDLVEDGYATYAQLESWGISQRERTAIDLLTRLPEGQTYVEYIDSLLRALNLNVPGAMLALRVKYFDLIDHVAPHRIENIRTGQVKRYNKALLRIGLILCREEE